MTARRKRQRERQRERRRAPETARRSRSAPAAAAARRHARRRGFCATAWLATGTTGAVTAAASPAHCSARGASSGADRGPRSLAHPLRSALPAAQPAWFGQRNRGPDRGRDPDRRCGARYGTGARPARHRQRWFPTVLPPSLLNSPLCRLARTHPCLRHSRIAWMRRCAAASVKRNSRTV